MKALRPANYLDPELYSMLDAWLYLQEIEKIFGFYSGEGHVR